MCVCNRPSSYIDKVFNGMWQLWQQDWGGKLVGWHSRIELGRMMGGCFIPSSLTESEKAACMWAFSCKFAFRTSLCYNHTRQLWLTSFKLVFFPQQKKSSQRLNTKKSVHFSKCESHKVNGKNTSLASGNIAKYIQCVCLPNQTFSSFIWVSSQAFKSRYGNHACFVFSC